MLKKADSTHTVMDQLLAHALSKVELHSPSISMVGRLVGATGEVDEERFEEVCGT